MWKQPKYSSIEKRRNVVYLYTAVLFGHKKEWSADTSYNMDELGIVLDGGSQSEKPHSVSFYFWEIFRIGKLIGTNCRLVFAKGWQEWGIESYVNEYEVSFQGDENVLEIDNGDGCTNMWYNRNIWLSHV